MDASSIPEPNATSPRRRNTLVVAAIVLVAVVAAVVLVITTSGGDADEEAGSCLADVAARMPADVTAVEASDLRAARQNGYNDSSVESMVESSVEMVTSPDPLTRRFVLQRFETDLDMPYRPSDVDCWIGASDDFVASGNFDRERFESADERLADLVAISEDNRLVASSASLLMNAEDDDSVAEDDSTLLAEAVEALGTDVVYSRLILGRVGGDDGGSWIGSSLSPDGSRWSVTTVWVYDDPAVAEEAEPRLRELLQGDQTQYPDLVAGDPSSDLTRDNTVVHVRSQLSGEPRDWYAMLNQLDPILLFDPRS